MTGPNPENLVFMEDIEPHRYRGGPRFSRMGLRAFAIVLLVLVAVLVCASSAFADSNRLRFGRGNAPPPAFPAVADQTLDFGRITRVGDGATAPINTGGAITSAGCTGVNSGHFTWSASGVVTPTVTPLQPSYTLNCTFTNAFGSSTPTVTINTEADTYSIATMAQMVAVGALSEAVNNGKTLKMRPGDYVWPVGNGAGSPFRNKVFASLVTVTSHDVNNRARFIGGSGVAGSNGVTYLLGTTNLRYYRLKWYAPWTYGVDTRSKAQGAAWVLGSPANNFIFQENEISSNWKELVETVGFPTLFSGTPASPNPVSACPLATNEWSICYTFRGLLGTTGASETLSGGLHIIDNTFSNAWRLLQVTGGTSPTSGGRGPINIIGNRFTEFSGDCINVINAPTPATVAWNVCDKPLSLTVDSNHRDAFQFLPGASPTGSLVFGNRTFSGRDDVWRLYSGIATDVQGHFMEDIQPNNYTNVKVFLNFASLSAVHGISVYNLDQGAINGNTIVMNPAWSANPSTYPNIRSLSDTPTVPPTGDVIADNVGYNVSYENPAWGRLMNNQSGVDPQTDYAALFVGPTFAPLTLAEAEMAFTLKPGGALDTAVPKRGALGTGYVDYTSRWWDYPRLNPTGAFTFADLTGQPTSTLVTTPGVQITAITKQTTTISPTTGAITYVASPSNEGALVSFGAGATAQVRITTDAGCAVVVSDWGSVGIVKNGQYVCLRDTSPATPATTLNVVVTVGANSDTWSITTS